MFFSRTQATWFLTEALFLVTLSVMCALAFAQTGEPARGNTPPGTSQDGSAPAHGAIKGGPSIAPGETAGVPGREPGNSPAESAEMRRRCDELTGPLRDECLDKPRDAATGGTAPRDVLKKPY
ncbi:MAG TPA: hypothetical protein VNU64_11205 [Burkholderiales bacterium]|nr:hypothetical protein [Burkholderiales bacterium]